MNAWDLLFANAMVRADVIMRSAFERIEKPLYPGEETWEDKAMFGL